MPWEMWGKKAAPFLWDNMLSIKSTENRTRGSGPWVEGEG